MPIGAEYSIRLFDAERLLACVGETLITEYSRGSQTLSVASTANPVFVAIIAEFFLLHGFLLLMLREDLTLASFIAHIRVKN